MRLLFEAVRILLRRVEVRKVGEGMGVWVYGGMGDTSVATDEVKKPPTRPYTHTGGSTNLNPGTGLDALDTRRSRLTK